MEQYLFGSMVGEFGSTKYGKQVRQSTFFICRSLQLLRSLRRLSSFVCINTRDYQWEKACLVWFHGRRVTS